MVDSWFIQNLHKKPKRFVNTKITFRLKSTTKVLSQETEVLDVSPNIVISLDDKLTQAMPHLHSEFAAIYCESFEITAKF